MAAFMARSDRVMISHTAEYALLAVVCLAQRQGESLTTQQIAELTHVPPSYLSKVLQVLARAGIIESRRGFGGGFTLMRDARSFTLLDVVNMVDPLPRVRTCPMGLRDHHPDLCPLHRKLDDVMAATERTLGQTTIASLIHGAVTR